MAGKIRSFSHFFGKIAFIKDAIMRRIISNTVKFGYQIPCLAGKISFVVDEKTNVYPCEMLSSLGNLRDNNYDFSKILDSEKLKLVRESWETGKPIEWIKVHMLPEYAYFNHSVHVNSGVACISCHGNIYNKLINFNNFSIYFWCYEFAKQ